MTSKSHLFFFIIVAIGIAVVFWYFGLWNKTKDILLSFNNVDLKSGIENTKESRQTIKNIAKTVTAIPEKIISQASQKIKDAFLESAKEEVSNAIDSAQQKFGLQSSASPNERPLIVSLISKKNSPLSFFIDSQENDVDYTIDWGDDNKSIGKLTSFQKKIIEHSWLADGSYLVTAEIVNKNKEIKKFSFPIAIE